MKYQEKYVGSKSDFYVFLKENFSKLVKEILEVEGEQIKIPEDKELVYKIKYENNEIDGSYAVKVTWVNQEIMEEEEIEEEF